MKLPRKRWKVVALFSDRQWYTWDRCFTERGAARKAEKLADGGLGFLPVSAMIAGIGYIHEDEELPEVPDFILSTDDRDTDERSEQP